MVVTVEMDLSLTQETDKLVEAVVEQGEQEAQEESLYTLITQ